MAMTKKQQAYMRQAIMYIALAIILFQVYNNYGYVAEYYLNRYIFYSTMKIPATHGGRNLLLYSNSTMSLTGDRSTPSDAPTKNPAILPTTTTKTAKRKASFIYNKNDIIIL